MSKNKQVLIALKDENEIITIKATNGTRPIDLLFVSKLIEESLENIFEAPIEDIRNMRDGVLEHLTKE